MLSVAFAAFVRPRVAEMSTGRCEQGCINQRLRNFWGGVDDAQHAKLSVGFDRDNTLN